MDKKILVVDDSQIVRKLVRQALVPGGYEVVEADTGADGLDKLKEHADVGLVICDVNMPVMGGLEMLEKLSDRTDELKVLVLSSEVVPELVNKAKALGASGWFVKPFEKKKLLGAVNHLSGSQSIW